MELWFWALLGVAALTFSWVTERRAIDYARTPRAISFGNSSAARSAVDTHAAKTGLAGPEWSHSGDGSSTRVLYPRARGRDPYQVVVTVASDGRATFRHVPEGTSRALLLGFIPLGPVMPHGVNEFRGLMKKLDGG